MEPEEILVKKRSKTDLKFGCRPEERPVSEIVSYGIANINKPKGPTSHQISGFVQKILGIDKAGHSGTLDPGVTGVLPVALGRATRIVEVLLKSGKEYVAVMHIHSDVAEGKIYSVVREFTGKIKQLPPLKSAVKRELRERTVYYVDIIEIDGKDVLLRMGCEAGTYVRKWVHDLGQKLGVGAHMAELVRTRAGPFATETAVTLQELEDAFWYWKNEGNEKYIRHCIQPVENAVGNLPKVWVLDSSVDSICHGAILHCPGISKLSSGIEKDALVALMSLKHELIALGTARMSSTEMLEKEKGVAVKPTKVFMPGGTYPKIRIEDS